MKTDFDVLNYKDLLAPVIFRTDFNKFQPIDSNQAWSLFFTAGNEDKELGFNTELGRFFTNVTIAVAVTGVIGSIIFTSIA